MNPWSSEALDSNRRGELTATQRDGFARLLRQRNRNALGIAAALLAVTALVGVFAVSSLSPVLRIAIVGVPLGIAVSLILRVLTGADKALGRDLRHGRVQAVTGAITKEQESAMDVDSTSVYILKVGDQRFTVAAMTFAAAPGSGQVRLYYLPVSRKVLNLEAFAEGTPTSAPRPLAEAIIGSWRNHPVLMPPPRLILSLPRARDRRGSAESARTVARSRVWRSATWTRSGYSEPHSRPGLATHHSRRIPMILQSTH